MEQSTFTAGHRADRLGTWSLMSFAVLLVADLMEYSGLAGVLVGPLGFVLGGVCVVVTLGALGYGLAGLLSDEPEQRRAAGAGLAKAAVPALVLGAFAFLVAAWVASPQAGVFLWG
jgi:hypothetical protein